MKVRPMLISIVAVLSVSLALPSVTIANHGYAKHKKQFNVIVFMADDLGQDAVPLYNPDDSELVQQRRDLGNEFPENAPMPALEELAKKLQSIGTIKTHPTVLSVTIPPYEINIFQLRNLLSQIFL